MTSATNAEESEREAAPPADPSIAEAPETTEEPEVAGEPAIAGEPQVVEEGGAPVAAPVVFALRGLTRTFGRTVAVDRIDLEVRAGTFCGIIGPNGAGKTTTLSMMTGLLRPDTGQVLVHGVDVWKDSAAAKRLIGVLPDRLRLFDRLTGAQFLYYAAALRGIDRATAKQRIAELAGALGLTDALERLISDYSAGMAKKVALAGAMIHAPRVLVLDEPFESVDPVSSAAVITVLRRFVAGGGTVVLSSHGLDFIERVCDDVAVIVGGKVLASGSVAEVAGTATLEERFLELAGGKQIAEGLQWLHDFSG
ncbi:MULTISPECIES: ABC transporter ATP-binding protein [unclassified Rathayibacter]|uniref:ABC transporter ATP-binding protein n=1 Tax=unclassified Rathayibacter TaxID=2609250 RepID=UPI00135A76C4|nr:MULTISPECIES: ABC transporter ATP-binding protein [unclassified Rathayibacter]MWV60507.1 ATP-binding cassette domain-containing protein [Rathayibacter sp. VKM Ac-2754]